MSKKSRRRDAEADERSASEESTRFMPTLWWVICIIACLVVVSLGIGGLYVVWLILESAYAG
jgi:hypothetical protein